MVPWSAPPALHPRCLLALAHLSTRRAMVYLSSICLRLERPLSLRLSHLAKGKRRRDHWTTGPPDNQTTGPADHARRKAEPPSFHLPSPICDPSGILPHPLRPYAFH